MGRYRLHLAPLTGRVRQKDSAGSQQRFEYVRWLRPGKVTSLHFPTAPALQKVKLGSGTRAGDRRGFAVWLTIEKENEDMNAVWLYPLIIVAGALQACRPPMNGTLRSALTNPWLASLASFLPVISLLGVVLPCMPHPLPTVEGIAAMPWWAPLDGLIGTVAVVVGLLFVNQVGAAGWPA